MKSKHSDSGIIYFSVHRGRKRPINSSSSPKKIYSSSQINCPWMGAAVDSGIGLTYRPASLAGRYYNPMPESTLSPQSGTMNLAADCVERHFLWFNTMYVTRFITSKIAGPTQDKKSLSRSLSRRRDFEVPSMSFMEGDQWVIGWRGRREPTFLVISAWLPNSQLHKMYIPRRKVSSSRPFPFLVLSQFLLTWKTCYGN